MNWLSLGHLIVFIADIGLLALVLIKNPRALINRFCGLIFVALAVWSISYARIHIASTEEIAMFWVNISSAGWILFPAANFYFYLALTDKRKWRDSKILLVGFTFVTVFFMQAQLTGNLVGSVTERSFGWAGVWSLTPISYLFFIYYFVLTCISIALIGHFWIKAKNLRQRQQGQLLFYTSAISLVLGSCTDVLFPIIGFYGIPQLADIFVSIWGFGIVLSITRYGLMAVSPVTAAGQILSTMSDALLLLDPDGRINMINKAASNLLKGNEGEIKGKLFTDFIAGERDFMELLKDATSTDKSANHEISMLTCKQESVPVLISTSPVHDQVNSTAGFVIIARDITERKTFEREIKEKEEFLRDIFNFVPAAIIVIDEETHKIIELNSLAAEIIGTGREPLIGTRCQEFICSAEIDRCPITDLHQKIDNSERKLRTIDGRTIDVLKSVVKLERNGRGQLLEIMIDITERKRAEAAILESEEKYRTIFESVSDILLLVDQQGNIRDVNRRIKDLGLYEKEDLVGANISSLGGIISGNSLPLIFSNFLKRKDGASIPVYEVEMKKKNGDEVNVEVNAVIMSSKEKFIGDLAILRDITARKKAENELKAQKDLIDRILSTIPNPVAVIKEDMRVVLANESFYKTFGLSPERVESSLITEVLAVDQLATGVQKILAGESPHFRIEFRYLINDSNRNFFADIMEMKQNEILVILTDITEEKERQDRWLLTDRLVSIGEMASGIAHELNNPLTGVIALSQILSEQEAPSEIKEDLKCICAEAQRAAAIVKNLLTFARKRAPEKRPAQLNTILEDVLKLRSYEHKINNIHINASLDPELPEVRVDYFQMQQVFLNIILNSEQAMQDTGREGTLTITSRKLNDHLELCFSDDGPGIAQENMTKLFSPFFTTKEVGRGTGLGLSICYGIITNHGGKIYAGGEFGKGATFTIELPLEKETPELNEEKMSPQESPFIHTGSTLSGHR